jgi:hypothetical protein
VLAGVSDLLAQRLSSRGAPANWRRTLSIALYGFLWAGPASHYWQQALERLFPNKKDPMRRCGALHLEQSYLACNMQSVKRPRSSRPPSSAITQQSTPPPLLPIPAA